MQTLIAASLFSCFIAGGFALLGALFCFYKMGQDKAAAGLEHARVFSRRGLGFGLATLALLFMPFAISALMQPQ